MFSREYRKALLFTIFINDMPKLSSHPCKLFTDDSKLVGIINNDLDAEQLQMI